MKKPTLAQWLEANPRAFTTVHELSGATLVYPNQSDVFGLYGLSDYVVTSASAMVLWLKPRSVVAAELAQHVS